MADRGDRRAFLDLHETVFGSWPRSDAPAIFDWKYVENPYLDHLPVVVATDGADVVGARGFTAFELCVGDDRVLGLQSGDLMVHPAHRRRGLFRAMNALALEAYADADALFFSSPAAAPRAGYLEDGWTRVRNAQFVREAGVRGERVRWPPSPTNLATHAYAAGYGLYRTAVDAVRSPSSDVVVERHDRVPVQALVRLYERERPSGVHAHRTREFYEWRLRSPRCETTTYLARRDGRLAAAVVVDETDSRVHLRELLPFAGASEPLLAVLDVVCRRYTTRPLVVWPVRAHRPALYRAGFLPKSLAVRARTPTDLVVNATAPIGDRTGVDVHDGSNWTLQLAERDY